MADSPRLAALGGAPAPAQLVDDLAQLCAMPEALREALWPVVERHLGAGIDPDAEAMVNAFAATQQVERDLLAPPIRASRALLRGAATRDLAPEAFTQDLNLLCGTAPSVVALLTHWYERALPLVRTRAVFDELAAFGPVLEEVKLRNAFVPVSRHHQNAVLPIPSLRLRYRSESGEKALVLQLTPAAVAALREVCARLPATDG